MQSHIGPGTSRLALGLATGCAIGLALGQAFPAQAQAPDARVVIPNQGQGSITFYERADFNGAAVTYRQSEASIRLPFVMRSVRAEGVWRMCTAANLGGRCMLVEGDHRDSLRDFGLMLGVGSVESRSQAGNSTASGGGWSNQQPEWQQGQSAWNGPPGGPGLRGAYVHFFAAPEIGRERIEACPGGYGTAGSCAAQTADRFCAYAGWGRALSYGQQYSGRRGYLVDVLCSAR